MDEIKKAIQNKRESIARNITESMGGEVEKAKNVGDIHPTKPWVWTEYKPGKFDWRIANSSKSNKPESDDEISRNPNAKPPDVKIPNTPEATAENFDEVKAALFTTKNEVDVRDAILRLAKHFGINTTDVELAEQQLSKIKSNFLDSKMYEELQDVTSYSGSWGVPNPTTHYNYHFAPEGENLKKFLSEKAKKSKSDFKAYKKQYDRSYGPDYRYQRPSFEGLPSYRATTLREVLANYKNRKKDVYGTLSSHRYKYTIHKAK